MSPKGRKRPAPTPEDFFWDCSVCTYKNNPEAFKCIMCDVRKGTSTRKSRINPDLVAVQVQQALLPPPPPQRPGFNPLGEPSSSHGTDEIREPSPGPSTQKKPKAAPKPRKPRQNIRQSKLKDVDHSTATTMDVTVDDVTIQITEYKLKKKDTPPPSVTTSRDNSVVSTNEDSMDKPVVSSKPVLGDESDLTEQDPVPPGQPSRDPSEECEPTTRSS
eukprot:TRINITY_DN22514_c0_g1_i2.p1 TRINITY_DN22514_c0_g1~~TRINITY_DN22514_c0_g1_i2.p1  ORF type:complete len:245 (-),score=57.03 TRINITY_DN22514_c0_g1_i2:182-832(-)